MVTHSNILTQRIPWIEKPDRLQFMGSQTVGHDNLATKQQQQYLIFNLKNGSFQDFPGHPVVGTPLPRQGVWVPWLGTKDHVHHC